jgi:uncharacterized integral membrane protein
MQDLPFGSPESEPKPVSPGNMELAWVVHWVGAAILGFFVVGVLYNSWPVALLKPAWMQTTSDLLVQSSFAFLIGALLMAAAAVLDPNNDVITKRANLVRRLASWAAIGYLLLIPVQVYAGVKLLQAQKQEQAELLSQVTAATNAIQKSTNLAELRQAYEKIPGTKPTLGTELTQPFEVARDQIVDLIRPRIKQTENEFDTRISSLWQKWLGSSFANVLRSLMLSVGFAAIGRKSPNRPTLLYSVFNRIAGGPRPGKFRMPSMSGGKKDSLAIPPEWMNEE